MGMMRKSRLSDYKQDRLMEHFVSGSTALTAARLCGVNRKTASYFFRRLREIIVLELAAESEALFDGEIEVDESYFGGGRKGKRGRGAAGESPCFRAVEAAEGFTQRSSRMPHRTPCLMPLIERKVVPDSIVYSDGWKGCNALDVSDFHHFRISHSERFAHDRNHINGIENFWSQAKRHLRRFNGIPKPPFGLYLKECAWRFNNSGPAAQLSKLR